MKKTLLAALVAVAAILPVAAPTAEAQGWRERDRDRYERRAERNDRRLYDNRGRYREPRRLTRNDRAWRGRDGRYYCRRDNGTTGLIIGGAVGALLGREIDGGRDRTLGTILGAAGGGLLGREIDRGGLRCR
jgi:uncharacterized protein YcfJ